jgi:hypothetical protein
MLVHIELRLIAMIAMRMTPIAARGEALTITSTLTGFNRSVKAAINILLLPPAYLQANLCDSSRQYGPDEYRTALHEFAPNLHPYSKCMGA